MKISALATLLLALPQGADALASNIEESPQLLSSVCSAAQGRTANCEVELDVPAACVSADGSSACPIVFFFHGAGGRNDWFARTSGVHSVNMIGVYPQGENGWNTGPKDTNLCTWDDYDCTSDPDEGAFIASIITELRNLGATGNVYLNGNSNGAALAHRLASNAGDELPIKGIITKVTQLLAAPPRSGPGVLNYNQPGTGGPAVSVLNIMGLDDGLIPYEGGSSSVFGDESFQLMSALESMATWAQHNQCSTSLPIISEGIVYSTSNDPNAGEATFYEYQGCPQGVHVEHYALAGAGHSFGKAAKINGVSIDYEMAYEFINRVESGEGGGGGGGGPGTSPNPTSSPVQSLGCIDDPNWHGKMNVAHTCEHIAQDPWVRCSWESTDGTLASTACKVTCGECSAASSNPTAGPTSKPTKSPSESLGCVDDATWNGKFNVDHTCAHIALEPVARCGWENTEGVKASDACPVACNTCSDTKLPTQFPTRSPVTPSPTTSPAESCILCSDNPTPWMMREGHDCPNAPRWLIKKKCNKENYWINNLFCEKSCQAAGFGYHATSCCE